MGLFETQLKRLHVCNLSNPSACGLGIQGYNTLRRQGISISRLLEDLSCLFTYQIRPNVRSPSEGSWGLGHDRIWTCYFSWCPLYVLWCTLSDGFPIKHVPRGNKMPECSVAFVEQLSRCPMSLLQGLFFRKGCCERKKRNGDIYIYSLDTMDGFMFFCAHNRLYK